MDATVLPMQLPWPSRRPERWASTTGTSPRPMAALATGGTGEEPIARDIARALIAFLLDMTPGSTQEDVPPLLEVMGIVAAMQTLCVRAGS